MRKAHEDTLGDTDSRCYLKSLSPVFLMSIECMGKGPDEIADERADERADEKYGPMDPCVIAN
jgi:hypothetical protein